MFIVLDYTLRVFELRPYNNLVNQLSYKGFTLVEILSIITIVSVLSIAIIPRFVLFHSSVSESKANLIGALTTARQVAIFASEQSSPIQFILQENTMSIRKKDKDIKYSGIIYPNRLGKNIKHTPETLVLTFNTLGETQQVNITLNSNIMSESIVVYSTGYVQ